MKTDKTRLLVGIILCIAGIGLLLWAMIMQCILSIQQYGVIMLERFIPDESNWGLVGAFPLFLGTVVLAGA